MDDAQFEELKALLLPIAAYVVAQTGQAASAVTTRSLMAQQAGAAAVTSMAAGLDNPGPYRVYRMNVPALADDVDPEGEPIWQVIGKGGVSTGFVGNHAEADAEAEKLNGAVVAAPVTAIPPGPANPGPYTHKWTLSGLWHVFGAHGLHTGFTGTQEEAAAEAQKLNDARSATPSTPLVVPTADAPRAAVLGAPPSDPIP